MKRILSALVAAFLLLSLSVPSFAAITPSVYGLTKEGNDIRLGTFKTSALTVEQKEFMRNWLSDTKGDAVLLYGTSFNSYQPYSFTFLLLPEGSTISYYRMPLVSGGYSEETTLHGPYSFVSFNKYVSVSDPIINPSDKLVNSGEGVGGRFYSICCLFTRSRMGSGIAAFQYNYSGKLLFTMDEDLTIPPVVKHDLTVNYQYANGTEAVGTYTGAFDEGTTYEIPSPVLAGYTPDKLTVSGTMAGADITETVTYTQKVYGVAVHYRYEDGSTAAPSYSGTSYTAAPYRIESPVISGYTADKLVVSGTMEEDPASHIVTYVKDAAPPVVNHNLTIRYLYAGDDALPAAEPYSHSYAEEEYFNIASPVIEGYAPDKLVVSGTMQYADKTETVIYTKKDVPPSSSDSEKYPLRIDYLQSDGVALAGAYNASLSEGEAYNVPSPVIGGYIPDKLSVFGTMPSRAVTERVLYKAASSGGGISGNPYVPWDVSLFYTAVRNLRNSVGVAFDIGIWIFVIITGIYLVIKIVNSLGK